MSEARRGRRMPFVIVPWAMLDDDGLTAHDILVYATIARYADGATGVAWPSRQTVATAARCDIKTVDRSVGRLVAAGYLEKHKRKHANGESNLYVVHEVAARKNSPKGGDLNGAGVGTQTVRPLGTQTVRELEPIELEEAPLNLDRPADPSEWTLPPEDLRARVAALTKD